MVGPTWSGLEGVAAGIAGIVNPVLLEPVGDSRCLQTKRFWTLFGCGITLTLVDRQLWEGH